MISACFLPNKRIGFVCGRFAALIFAASIALWALISIGFYGVCHAETSHWGDAQTRFAPWPHEGSDLKPSPNLRRGRLENGFRYVLMRNSEPKKRVSVHLNVQAGSLNERDGEEGLAHFLEHMLFRGSNYFAPGELIKYFQSLGMQFGPDVNAHTGFKETVYDILLPDGSRNHIGKAIIAAKDFARGALLLDSEIDKERNVVLAEKQSRDSVEYRTLISTLGFEFPGALISKRLPIGREAVLKTADRGALKKFYDTWYRPDLMILVMVGEFDLELAETLIKNEFSSLPEGQNPARSPDFGPIDHRGIKTFYHHEKEAGATTVSIETVEKIKPVKDSISFRKTLFIKDVADAMVRNRLEALTGDPDTPFTGAFINSGIYLDTVKYSEIYAECDPANWKASLALIEKTFRDALTYGFTEYELERIKKTFLNMLDDAEKKAPTRNSSGLSRQIIFALNNQRVFLSPTQKKELFVPILNQLTLADVHKAFKNTWSSNHRLVLAIGNLDLTKTGAAPEGIVRKAFEKSAALPAQRPKRVKNPEFPYLPIPEKSGAIASKKVIPDLGITRAEFANGVVLNVKRTDFQANSFHVNLIFGDGKQVQPDGRPAMSLLAAGVVNESGLGGLDKDELERALSGKNTRVHFYVADDFFGFKGAAASGEVSLMFQLLYAHLQDPGFREKALRLSLERFDQEYKRLKATVDGVMRIDGERFLYGGNSRFGLPKNVQEFSMLSLNDVEKWVRGPLTHDRIEISVVGDVDVNEVISEAAKYLGSLPERSGSKMKKSATLPFFPEGQTRKITAPSKITKGLTTVAWPTEDIWNIKRSRALTVLGSLLSERLRVRIRETLGVSYSPVAFNQSSKVYPEYGALKTLIYADPQKMALVEGEVKKIARDLAENGVTDDELQRVIEPVLVRIRDLRRQNGYWLDMVMTGSERYPQQLEWSRSIINDYEAISREYLSSLAKKYLDPSKAAVLIIVNSPDGDAPKKDPPDVGSPGAEPFGGGARRLAPGNPMGTHGVSIAE